MSWRAYFAAFAIHSPIHIGYNSISHADRTRYYIPGRNMMSAFAHSLDAQGVDINTGVLQVVRESMLFSTFFVSKNGKDALFPVLTNEGDLFYGKEQMALWDFTNQFISAKEGQKYQRPGKGRSDIEFIVPKNKVINTQNYLVGYIFVADDAEDKGLGAWIRALRELHIGEETHNKMGNVRMIVLEKLLEENMRKSMFSIDGITLDWAGEKIQVVYEKPGPLLGYLKAEDESSVVAIYGVQESTEGSVDLLKNVSIEAAPRKCWVPGTFVKPDNSGSAFTMGYDGMLHT